MKKMEQMSTLIKPDLYTIKSFNYINDEKMSFIVKINLIDMRIIIEGYYNLKINKLTKNRLLAIDEYSLNKENDNSQHFEDIIEIMIADIYKRVEFYNIVNKIFTNVDAVGIKND